MKVDDSGCYLQGDSLSFSSKSQSKVLIFILILLLSLLFTPKLFVQGVLADKVILRHLGPGLITQDLVVYQVNQSFLDAHQFLGKCIYMLLKGTISYLLLFQGQFSFKYSDPVCYPSNSSTAGQWCLWLYYIVQMISMHWMLYFMIFLDSGVCNHVKAHFI